MSTVGSYLLARISADGEDSRFKDIRGSPPKFFGAFMVQATWVSLCLMPVLAVNALPASTFAALGTAVSITDLIGILLYVGGLSFEVIADRQRAPGRRKRRRRSTTRTSLQEDYGARVGIPTTLARAPYGLA
jgi:steroid 5-alpha reductase family enzyme